MEYIETVTNGMVSSPRKVCAQSHYITFILVLSPAADDITKHSSNQMSLLTFCHHVSIFIFSKSQNVRIKLNLIRSGSDARPESSANTT